MSEVRIVHAEPWPGRLPEAGFAISEFLVLLADDAGRRALPVWLNGIDGDPLWRILDQPAAEPGWPAPRRSSPAGCCRRRA